MIEDPDTIAVFSWEEFKKKLDALPWWKKAWYRFTGLLKDARYSIRKFRQRLFRGYADVEVWNLYTYTAKFILKRLDKFIEKRNSHPCSIPDEEWEAILRKIWNAMHLIVNDYDKVEDIEAIEEGCKLLGEYFTNLWD